MHPPTRQKKKKKKEKREKLDAYKNMTPTALNLYSFIPPYPKIKSEENSGSPPVKHYVLVSE
jgi:hypothetical protein